MRRLAGGGFRYGQEKTPLIPCTKMSGVRMLVVKEIHDDLRKRTLSSALRLEQQLGAMKWFRLRVPPHRCWEPRPYGSLAGLYGGSSITLLLQSLKSATQPVASHFGLRHHACGTESCCDLPTCSPSEHSCFGRLLWPRKACLEWAGLLSDSPAAPCSHARSHRTCFSKFGFSISTLFWRKSQAGGKTRWSVAGS